MCRFTLQIVMFIVLCAVSSMNRADDLDLLDPSTGEIDGTRALSIFPVRYEGPRSVEILDVPGCEVHMVSMSSRDARERVHPCGVWFLEDPGHYLYWVQSSDWRISPYAREVIYTAGPFQGSGFPGAAPVGPAGRVVPPRNVGSKSGYQLRLLQVEPYLVDGMMTQEMWRGVDLDRIGDGVLMPVGLTVAGLWDKRAERYVMFSRSFKTEHGQVREAPLEAPPDSHAFLVVKILRREKAPREGGKKIEVVAVRGADRFEPDLVAEHLYYVYSIWYDLPAGRVEVRAGTEEDVLEPTQIELEGGTIERVSGHLTPRPALDVELEISSLLSEHEAALEVRRLPSGEVVARRELAPDSWSERIEGLPRAPLEVEFQSVAGAVSKVVDLSDGSDGFVHLELDPVVLTGHVLLGDEPHTAELTFMTVQKQTQDVRTDENGRFELIALKAIRNVSIELDGVEMPPFVEFFPQAITGTTEHDFVVPDRRFTLRVVDAVTGAPIPDASIFVRNQYDEDGEPGYDMAVAQQVESDENGIARLPPLRAGELEARASADGYAQMQEPAITPIAEETEEGTLEIVLEPLGETVDLRLRLATGAPADGARVALVDSLANGSILVESTADSAGEVAVPVGMRGVLLIYHDQAAFMLRSWPTEPSDESMEWNLAAMPARPLVVRVLDPEGESAVRRAGLAVWVDGWRLSGLVLAWLTQTRGFADDNGFWSASNLPSGPVSILAYPLQARGAVASGGWDMLATEVPVPWPETLEVRATRIN